MARRPAAGPLLAVLLTAACTDTAAPPAAQPRITIVETPGLAAVVQHSKPGVTGHLSVRVLTARCGITFVTGTHAEFTPARPGCDLRLRITSLDAVFHTFTTSDQRLVTAAGELVEPSRDLMNVKRQPLSIELPARAAVELDVWFEPPLGSRVTALSAAGDRDEDPPGSTITFAGPASVQIPLSGLG